ncbi:hypothetical protein [Halegenticoccus soli]|uniref:hypothetical protein n=1 Tax=Halegenticoccus soli TaxID=1985678 RepID=UPI000C6D0B17|nr:hypothetical protein [Halegenticoccus soli]
MPIDEDRWDRAAEVDDLLTTVREILEAGAPSAYAVEDLFRDAGPAESGDSTLVNAIRDAVGWQLSRRRSEILVEMALETLVYHGNAEKRAIDEGEDGEVRLYYRAA